MGTHFADEEDRVALATSAGLVLDLEMRDRKRIANGLLQVCKLYWHFCLVQLTDPDQSDKMRPSDISH